MQKIVRYRKQVLVFTTTRMAAHARVRTFKHFLVEGGDLGREQRVNHIGAHEHHGGSDTPPRKGRGHLSADVTPADQDNLQGGEAEEREAVLPIRTTGGWKPQKGLKYGRGKRRCLLTR